MKKVLLILLLILILALSLCACDEARKLSFATDSITVSVGTSFIPDMKISPRKAKYSLSSGNSTIATVADNVVTTQREGTVTLTATSGDKEATCELYVVGDRDIVPTDVKILNTYLIKFYYANYEIAGLDSCELESVYAYEGSYVSVNLPTLRGYAVDGWFVDKECSVRFDNMTKVTSSFALYAHLTELDTAYNVVAGYVTGLLYPNLDHAQLELPAYYGDGLIYGIADEAFIGDEEITKVTIPSTYLTIGKSAFAGCKNLTTVVIPNDSQLNTVGENAFGVLRNKYNQITDGCGNLTSINLPDTVNRVGAFAFYNCTKLILDGIPSGLSDVEQYAFAGTKINNVSLANINNIYEGAFKDCTELDAVTNTENVGSCAKLAFDGSKLVSVAKTAYNGSHKDEDAAYYAGTILFGIHEWYGKSLGSGKLHIKDATTLIADEAFCGDNQAELTLYIDTEIASGSVGAVGYNFLGKNVFKNSPGVFIVVKNGSSEAFRARYDADNTDRNYADKIVEEERVEVAGNSDTVNYGTHILLKKTEPGGVSYYYDKFIDGDGGTRIVRLDADNFPSDKANNLVRINMGAFNNHADLVRLGLGKAHSIAYFAINQCPELIRIELDKTISPMQLEDALSIRFGSCTNALVYVRSSDLGAYQAAWANFPTAYSKLTTE